MSCQRPGIDIYRACMRGRRINRCSAALWAPAGSGGQLHLLHRQFFSSPDESRSFLHRRRDYICLLWYMAAGTLQWPCSFLTLRALLLFSSFLATCCMARIHLCPFYSKRFDDDDDAVLLLLLLTFLYYIPYSIIIIFVFLPVILLYDTFYYLPLLMPDDLTCCLLPCYC